MVLGICLGTEPTVLKLRGSFNLLVIFMKGHLVIRENVPIELSSQFTPVFKMKSLQDSVSHFKLPGNVNPQHILIGIATKTIQVNLETIPFQLNSRIVDYSCRNKCRVEELAQLRRINFQQ